MPSAPVLADITVDGREIKALVLPTKQSWLFVLDRETGVPVWPIEEVPVEAGDVPGEWYSPTQPIPTQPPAVDLLEITVDDLIDYTPELRAQAEGNPSQVQSRFNLYATDRRERRREARDAPTGDHRRDQLARWVVRP